MSDDPFIARVKTLLVPRLRSQGFKGRFPTFRRVDGVLIHEVNVQGVRYGGQRTINLSIGFSFLANVSAHNNGIEYTYRIGTSGGVDRWWDYNPASTHDAESQADDMITVFHEEADAFFARFSTFPGSFAHITPEDLESAPASYLPPRGLGSERNVARDCLVFMYMWHHLGQPEYAKKFAETGRRHAQQARTLMARFDSYLASASLE